MNTKKILYLTAFISLVILMGCSKTKDKKAEVPNPPGSAEKKVVIFHAGSLSVPLMELKKAYEKNHPDTNIVLEAAGSVTCARKITDLKKPCDLMISADYQVIDQILVPDYADWNIKFATNQLSIVFTDKSKFAKEINSENWYKILMQRDVLCGASNPNEDPCGYRTELMLKLATIFYKEPELYRLITLKGKMLIRPKETDLISLLEADAIDYMFIYKSVAVQHNLKYVTLPGQINLADTHYSDFYKQAEVEIDGATPGSKIKQIGSPIVYGLTMIKDAPDKDAALSFLEFMLSDAGLKIIKESGQEPIVPSETDTYNNLPGTLKKFALPLK